MPSRRPLAAALVCVALVAGACGDGGGDDGGGDDETAPTTTARAAGPTRSVPELTPLTVELLQPGTEPRAVLAHRIEAGTSWTGDLAFTLAVDTVATVTAEGVSRIDHRSVDANGTTSAAYALEDLDLTIEGDDPRTTVPDAVTISGRYLVDADRTVQEATVETDPGDSQLAAGVQGFASALDPRLPSLLLPFPSAPIGTGAEWLITGPLTFFGNQVRLSTRAALIERTGDDFRIDIAVSMTTPDDSGNDIELTGLGQVVGRVTQLGPVQGRISLEGTILLADRSLTPLPMTLDLEITER